MPRCARGGSSPCAAGRIDFQNADRAGGIPLELHRMAAAAGGVSKELGEPEPSGRRRPVTKQGSEFDLPLSVAIIAIGTSANPIVQSTTPGLGTNNRGYIQANEETQRTTRKSVFAGGDIATSSTTVIVAMGAGRRAPRSIHEYLTTGVR